MLKKLLKELSSFDVFVIDSPETFGKMRFWQRWKIAREYCLQSKHDNFLILPDDVCKLNFTYINALFAKFENTPFFCNVINDGRTQCWGEHRNYSNDFTTECDYSFFDLGYFDCGGLTNRATLKQIDIEPVPYSWFDSPNKSSGVGKQITVKARILGIPMFTPSPSLAYHGAHKSVMHEHERQLNKLISK